MPTKEEILAELGRRGVQAPPALNKEAIMQEVRLRGLQVPEPSLFDRAKAIYGQRTGEMAKIAADYYPEQTMAEDAIQAMGQVGAGIGELGFEALKRGVQAVTPDSIEEAVVQKAGELAQTDEGQFLLNKLEEYSGDYKRFAQENPRLHRNLAGMLGVAEAVPVGVAGKAAAKTGKDVAGEIKSAMPKAAPSFDDVKSVEKAAWDRAYDTAEQTGAKIPSIGISKEFDFNLNKSMDRDMKVDPDLHPKTTLALEKVKSELGNKNVTPQQIQITRRKLGDLREKSRGDMGKATDDTRIMNDVIMSFDDAVDSAAAKGTLSTNKEVTDLFKDARKVSRVKYKADLINDAFERADRAGSSFDRAIKGEFRRIANNKRKMKQFSKKEAELINKAAKTGMTEGTLRALSVFDPTSGKLSAAIGLGAMGATGNVLFPALGMLSKASMEAMAKGKGKKVLKEITKQIEETK